jgi:hypothetical protein
MIPAVSLDPHFVYPSATAVLRADIEDYLKRSDVDPRYRVATSSRPPMGDTPTIELVLGYKKSNKSPILNLLLSRSDELVARVSNKVP